MNKDLNSYIKIYNVLDHNKCQETITELEHCNFELHQYSDYKKQKYQYDKELSVFSGVMTHHEYFMSQIWDSLRKYVLEIKLPWYTSWAGFSPVRYNRYNVGTEMREHCDHIHTLFDGERAGVPVLSIVGCLNEEFLGGKFIMFEDEEIFLDTGDLLIFPSTFLFPHKVTEVTDGTRYTFVSWAW